MASSQTPADLGQVLVDFTVNGIFPESESVSSAPITPAVLNAALKVLNDAKVELEKEVKEASRQAASNVDGWIAHAKSIRKEVDDLKRQSNDIVRRHAAGNDNKEMVEDQKAHVGFLEKEVIFQEELYDALKQIYRTNILIKEAARLADEKDILSALDKLAEINGVLESIPLDKTCRALRLLESKCSGLKHSIHDQLSGVWSVLIVVDLPAESITFNQQIPEGTITSAQAVHALYLCHKLEKTAQKLWEDLDEVILSPRTYLGPVGPRVHPIRDFKFEGNKVYVSSDPADHSIKELFRDLTRFLDFLQAYVPAELLDSLSNIMMPPLTNRILESWLDTAIPADLNDTVEYQKTLALVSSFTEKLVSMKWPGMDGLVDWVQNAPKIWLNKKREKSLEWTRDLFTRGIGVPRSVERVEKRMVPKDEGNHIATTGVTSLTDDWDKAWGSDEEEVPSSNKSRHRDSINEERQASQLGANNTASPIVDTGDDVLDAWNWGDEDDTAEDTLESNAPPSPTRPVPKRQIIPAEREMTLSEKYWISSLPEPIFRAVVEIFNDGVSLSQPDRHNLPIAPAARGLFALPSLILALFRAVASHYYSIVPGGNMYLYNDAFWLSERFTEFVAEWKTRTDLPPSCLKTAEKLNPEIQTLVSFSKRAYTNELNAQRGIIKDLLGRTQNFFQQDGLEHDQLGEAIETVIAHVQSQAKLWEAILPYSACASATGALVNAIASKLIEDVFEIEDIGVDEAERLATLLARLEILDDLFLPKDPAENTNIIEKKDSMANEESKERVPLTAQFADKWMKMKFLGEVLQSNLREVRFLWFESDLSIYFSVEEVVELVRMSFRMSGEVKGVVREIRNNPDPRELGWLRGEV